MKLSFRTAVVTLSRGARGLCPRCGEGRLFTGWYNLRHRCHHCDLDFNSAQDNAWAFMYVTTAGLTGVIIVGMFLIAPRFVLAGQIFVGLAAVLFIVGTIPYRKGIAISIEYLIDTNWAEK
jgi:uncharacterized protein (DUF983 family)